MSKKKLTVTQTIRKEIENRTKAGDSLYRIAKDAGVSFDVIYRFMADPDRGLKSENIDALAGALGLSLAERVLCPDCKRTVPIDSGRISLHFSKEPIAYTPVGEASPREWTGLVCQASGQKLSQGAKGQSRKQFEASGR